MTATTNCNPTSASPQKAPLARPACPSTPRLAELRAKLFTLLPAAQCALGTDPMGHSTMTVSLPNGIEVLASGDVDLPWLLFEVVRSVEPGDVPQHPFEACASERYAYCDKLSGQAAVDLIIQYAQLPVVTSPAGARP